MGIDVNGAQLLVRARQSGVSFARMAMLGHQSLHCNRPALVSVLRNAGCELSRDFVRSLLDPTNEYADEFFRVLGAREMVVIDASDYEGAQIVHDMNRPVPASLHSCFDLVLDSGTLEHVFDVLTALRNAAEMVRPEGRFISITMANNFCGHGFYQFSPELFYRFFSSKNGYAVESCIAWDGTFRSRFYRVSDPDIVQSRVNLESDCGGVYMAVQARRLGDVSRGFIPQQSDYVRLWGQSPNSSSRFDKLKAALRRNPAVRSAVAPILRTFRLQRAVISSLSFRRRLRGSPPGALTPLKGLRVRQ